MTTIDNMDYTQGTKTLKKFHLNDYFRNFHQKHSMTLIIYKKRKSFHNFHYFYIIFLP